MTARRAQPFSVRLRASRSLLFWVWAAHGAALLVLPALPLPAMAAGAGWVALSLFLSLRVRGATSWRQPPPSVDLLPDGHIEWQDGTELVRARVLPHSLRLPWICIIVWDSGRSRGRLVLARDMLDADGFRRVRVWLKLNLSESDVAAA